MTRFVEEKRDEIIRLCEQYRVKCLELFGSAAGEDFDPQKSDMDFLVEFLPGPVQGSADQYFGLLENLQQLFGCAVDLVELSAIDNPYFLEGIEASREVLYAA